MNNVQGSDASGPVSGDGVPFSAPSLGNANGLPAFSDEWWMSLVRTMSSFVSSLLFVFSFGLWLFRRTKFEG